VAEVIGQPALTADARFATDAARSANDAVLRSHIEQWSLARCVTDVVAAFEARQVPCAAIARTGQAVGGDQVAERGLLSDVQHPFWGRSRVATQPVRFAPSSPRAAQAAPALGGDSDAVLQQWLGMEPCAIDRLHADGVI
jgi:CoA:oxalate CoA-transferase